MINFAYYNPTRIIFGTGQLSQLPKEATLIGKKPLLMFGKSSAKKSGLSDIAENMISNAGLTSISFFGVEPNPRATTCDEASELARANNCDMIAAIGGGSVMDAAKLVAISAITGAKGWDYVLRTILPEKALPIIMVPTLAATGSEFNLGAVITNWELHQKLSFYSPLVFPKLSIIDPELTITCPLDMTAYGAVDIIIHVMETYLSTPDNDCPLQDYISEGVCKTVIENIEKVLDNPDDIKARSQLSWASSVALCGLPNSGRPGGFLLHWMEHIISAHYDIQHGLGLAYLLLPALEHYFKQYFPARYDKFYKNVMPNPKGFLESIGCYATLDSLGIPKSAVSVFVSDLFAQKGDNEKLPGYPGLDKAMAEKIFSGI
jgi:alcohol dehydrogenase YqhD (iron-dependent ADH family)